MKSEQEDEDQNPYKDHPYFSKDEVESRNAAIIVYSIVFSIIGLDILFSEKPHALRFIFLIVSIVTVIYFLMAGGFDPIRLKKEIRYLLNYEKYKDFGSLLLLIDMFIGAGIIFYRDDVFFRLDTLAQLSATVGVIILTIIIGLIRSLLNRMKSKSEERFK